MHGFLLYIDPGSTSLLFQFIVSAFLTVMIFFKKVVVVFKYMVHRIRVFLGKKKR